MEFPFLVSRCVVIDHCIVSFHLSCQWHTVVTGDDLTETPPEANPLSKSLQPPVPPQVIESDQVKCAYLCHEVQIAELPSGLLIFPDNQLLFQKCATYTLVPSNREIIQYNGGLYLEKIISRSRSSSSPNHSSGSDSASRDKGKEVDSEGPKAATVTTMFKLTVRFST